MSIQKEDLIRQITEAFKDVSPPANNFGIYSAEAADDYRDPTKEEKLLDRIKSWKEITIKQMADCPAALSHLKPDGLRFYLPAFLILSLRHEEDAAYNCYAFMSSPEYSLYRPSKGLEEHIEKRHSQFNQEQAKAFIAYLEYRVEEYSLEDLSSAIEYWKERFQKL